jgi:formate hydrogenlyase subunit 4
MDSHHDASCGGGIIMLQSLIWFLVIMIVVPVLYLIENFIRSMMPGYNKSYLLQPIYRLMKLFGKRGMKTNDPAHWFSIVSCWFAICALFFTVRGENILFIFTSLVMMELFILAGSWNAREPFGSMAAQRGIARFFICAFTFMVSAASLYQVTGTLSLKEMMAYSWMHYLLLKLPLAFLAMIVVLLIRGSLLFFDFNITGKGLNILDSALYTPYSGWSLGITQITRWVEIGVWLKLISVFLPWKPWFSFTVLAICYLAFLLTDGFIPKARWKKVARNAFLWGGGMSVMNFIWLYLF